MTVREDFLVEILTEELPPKTLWPLAQAFLQQIKEQIEKSGLTFAETRVFATPRRLAVLVHDLDQEQPAQTIERKGPALAAAYDSEGKPTQACIGFARSCNTTPEQLTTIKNKQGSFVGFTQHVPGKPAILLLPTIVQQALMALPIPKRMRWGNETVEFIRPVHSVILLYGNEIIEATILGCHAGRTTFGHRFHAPEPISIPQPSAYLGLLHDKGFVMADFAERMETIRREAREVTKKQIGDTAQVVLSDALLEEVTGLVEWPFAICGQFDSAFLSVPAEVLISAMQDHQRYFPVIDGKQKLLPNFIAISNIQSKNSAMVIKGNERVLRARLSDAAFFFEKDKVETLDERLQRLKGIVFQAKLGTLYEKAERLSQLSTFVAKALGENVTQAARAGLLAKTDLTSEMVGEFPELQGVMGYYYASNEGENATVATAIREHYQPRFAGNILPETRLGWIVALADRLDTLAGIFGIHQAPTGDKDPFALRRAALGVIRILIEKELDLDLRSLLTYALDCYGGKLENGETVTQILNFVQERLKFWYQEQDISADIFAAVAALGLTRPFDLHRRIQAVRTFKNLSEAAALSAANKRVSNILTQAGKTLAAKNIDAHLFEHDAERELAKQLEQLDKTIQPLYRSAQYVDVLRELAHLRAPVDDFFDHVMVMTEDTPRRENRLLLLSKLRAMFLQVADIALLQ